jgi:hypothetical protein
MNTRIRIAYSVLAFAVAVGVACAESTGSAGSAVSANYSSGELKAMMRNAHTQQDDQMLATYFRGRQQSFEQKAQAEKVEWDRRSQNVTSVSEKYPRPVDSSKYRYEYFTYEAQQMSQQAAHYEQLTATASASR